DPLSHKNRELSPLKLVGVACNAKLVKEYAPVLTPPFPDPAQRFYGDGTFGPLSDDDFGLLFRPMVVQVSRWDRLKGFRSLLEGFCLMKTRARQVAPTLDARQARRLDLVRL